jgi:hypothetical protein
MLGNYQVASQLMASRVVLSSIELVKTSRTVMPWNPVPVLILTDIVSLQNLHVCWEHVVA